jgi:hypothetical protein
MWLCVCMSVVHECRVIIVYTRTRRTCQYDAVAEESAAKKMEFHHSKLVRQVDLLKSRKRKKLSWLKKMYKLGGQNGNTDAPEQEDDPYTQTMKQLMAVDEKSDDVFKVDWEEEADDLLQWTENLNFGRCVCIIYTCVGVWYLSNRVHACVCGVLYSLSHSISLHNTHSQRITKTRGSRRPPRDLQTRTTTHKTPRSTTAKSHCPAGAAGLRETRLLALRSLWTSTSGRQWRCQATSTGRW